jgi:hypothetical protein
MRSGTEPGIRFAEAVEASLAKAERVVEELGAVDRSRGDSLPQASRAPVGAICEVEHRGAMSFSVLGWPSTSILNTSVRAIDEHRRDAIHKLEKLRAAHEPSPEELPRHPKPVLQ